MSSTPKVDVVGVGLNATDTLIPVRHYPPASSKVEFRFANVLPGGQVATAMGRLPILGTAHPLRRQSRPRFLHRTTRFD